MTLVIFKYKKPHHHHAQLRPVAHINLAHYLLLVNFTLWCSNIAEIRPCEESTSVESCAETLSPSDKIRLVLISSCSNQTITFVPESYFGQKLMVMVLSLLFMSLYMMLGIDLSLTNSDVIMVSNCTWNLTKHICTWKHLFRQNKANLTH